MKEKIEVVVDIYRNYFRSDIDSKYCYSNIRAVKESEQPIADLVIQNMINEGDNPLLEQDLTVKNEYRPIEENRKCFLNLSTKQFEF